jgi:hypothetical protein
VDVLPVDQQMPRLEITAQCAHPSEFGIAFSAQKMIGNSKRALVSRALSIDLDAFR